MNHQKLTQEVKELLIDDYERGENVPSLAIKYKLSVSAVYSLLRNCKRTKQKGRPKREQNSADSM